MTETVETPVTPAVPSFPPARGKCPYQPSAGYAELRAGGPVAEVRLIDGKKAWVVTGHAEARSLLTDPRLSADRSHPQFPNNAKILPGTGMPPPVAAANALTFAQMDDPEHGWQRRLVAPRFTPRQVAALRPKIQRTADLLVDDLVAAGPGADLVSLFAVPLPSMVLADLFGVPEADRPVYQQNVQYLATQPDMMVPAVYALYAYYAGLFETKRVGPSDDLASHMVTTTTAGAQPGLQQLLNSAMLITSSGNESTMAMISLGALAVLSDEQQAGVLRDDPAGAAPAAVQELLRYVSVGDIVSRLAVADIEVGGHVIRAGEGVILATPAINRDPGVFTRPDELDLRREAGPHLAFGHGAHRCVAMRLATTALEVVFTTLFSRIPTLRLAVAPEQIQPGGFGVHWVAALPVTW